MVYNANIILTTCKTKRKILKFLHLVDERTLYQYYLLYTHLNHVNYINNNFYET